MDGDSVIQFKNEPVISSVALVLSVSTSLREADLRRPAQEDRVLIVPITCRKASHHLAYYCVMHDSPQRELSARSVSITHFVSNSYAD